MPRAPTTEELIAHVLAHVAGRWPAGVIPLRIIIALSNGEEIKEPIPPTLGQVTPLAGDATADSADSSDLRDHILELLSEVTEPLKSSAIARRLNRKFNGHFRGTVKKMRDDGEITSGADGLYSLAN